jgi:hypothetical protein
MNPDVIIDLRKIVAPIVDVGPIHIANRPEFPGDNHFWQYPCATERLAFGNHELIGVGENIDAFSKVVHTYLGLPWATYIDRKSPYLNDFDTIAGRIMELKSNCRKRNFIFRIHTVCQHIHWRRLTDWYEKLGITDLHLSHSEKEVHGRGNKWPFRVHSWPLIAVSVEGMAVLGEGVHPKAIHDRHYLASFIGAHMPHYRSDVRLQLQVEAQGQNDQDVIFELREVWHYNKIVYEEQVEGRMLNSEELDYQQAGINRYNEILSNSIFSLCPEGAGPNTLRIWESLALGAIPVIIAEGWIPPVAYDDVQLEDCCIFVLPNEITGLFTRLRSLSSEHLQWMQTAGRNLYEMFRNYRSFAGSNRYERG